jgi:predicted phosphohydrolase
MAIFAIADPHLSIGCDKPMDIFAGWYDYTERIRENWCAQVGPQDTVVLAGDISWGMTLEMAADDFSFLHALPGRKVLIKGNHDYWWSSRKKMEGFFAQNNFDSLFILHNSCIQVENIVLCGTRGWMLEDGEPHDSKIKAREEGRLRASLKAAVPHQGERVVFLHYPPIYGDSVAGGMLDILLEYDVKRCYYGHLHGVACSRAFEGNWMGIEFRLISADCMRFALCKI